MAFQGIHPPPPTPTDGRHKASDTGNVLRLHFRLKGSLQRHQVARAVARLEGLQRIANDLFRCQSMLDFLN